MAGITAEQGDRIISLLGSILAELQRPRLTSEALNRRSHAAFAQDMAAAAERQVRVNAAQAALPSARAVVGQSGIPVIRDAGPDEERGPP